jgi:hypothetical protein
VVAAVQPDTLATVAREETSLRLATLEKLGLLVLGEAVVAGQVGHDTFLQTTTTPAAAAAALGCLGRAATALVAYQTIRAGMLAAAAAGQAEQAGRTV